MANKFLSTPSARRATDTQQCNASQIQHFYPRPPRGGRQIIFPVHLSIPLFLSTPSARRATVQGHDRRPHEAFLSTPSARRATAQAAFNGALKLFLSTPSARRATSRSTLSPASLRYFYPRPPRGGRQQKRRKTSPLLFHYKTICTDLEELFQKHPKKELRSAQNSLKTWCEGDGKGVSAFHSH